MLSTHNGLGRQLWNDHSFPLATPAHFSNNQALVYPMLGFPLTGIVLGFL